MDNVGLHADEAMNKPTRMGELTVISSTPHKGKRLRRNSCTDSTPLTENSE